jgi:hypothetical protein
VIGTGPYLMIIFYGSEMTMMRFENEEKLLAAVRSGQSGEIILAKELHLSVSEDEA